MTTEQIVKYVLKTPLNTNRAILTAMLQELEGSGGIAQLRRDDEYNYNKIADVFIPLNGEICLVDTQKDGLRAKCGDGKTVWKDLEYIDDYVVKGYFYNDKFYKDQLYTKSIEGATQKIYIDLGSCTIYFYEGGSFIPTSGEAYGQATPEKSGIMKLYQTIGDNADGTMSQKAITDSQKTLEDKIDDKFKVTLNMTDELLIFSHD